MLSVGQRVNGNRYDAVVVGAGHNGLVAAAYLGRAGLKVALLESREILGGPVGTYEFMPGYKTAFSNSPGSFEPRIIQELELERHGLHFRRMDPTLVHHFPEKPFISWRDRSRTDEQLNRLCPGEADRFHNLVQELENLAVALNISLFRPDRDLQKAREKLSRDHRCLFDEVFTGSLQSFLDARLRTTQAKALLGMVALNVTMAPPSQPGTAVGLMLRPISKVSHCVVLRACRLAAWGRLLIPWNPVAEHTASISVPTPKFQKSSMRRKGFLLLSQSGGRSSVRLSLYRQLILRPPLSCWMMVLSPKQCRRISLRCQ